MKLTISQTPTTISSPTGPVKLRAFQIAVPLRLVVQGILSQEFAAILDTGLNHNLAIREEQLQQWAQVVVKRSGMVTINGYPIPVGQADLVLAGKVLPLRDGIVVYPAGTPFSPRLPTLGLRALVRHKVRLVIDGVNATIG